MFLVTAFTLSFIAKVAVQFSEGVCFGVSRPCYEDFQDHAVQASLRSEFRV